MDDHQTQKIFRVKVGYCHILPDKIAFSKDGRPESLDLNEPKQHAPTKFMTIYGLVLFSVSTLLIYKYTNNELDLTSVITTFLIISVFIYYLFKVLNYQTRTYFERDRIISVKYKPSLGPLTHGQFNFSIKSENGKILHTSIILRDHNVFGKKETDEAIKIMVDEKLIDDPKVKNIS